MGLFTPGDNPGRRKEDKVSEPKKLTPAEQNRRDAESMKRMRKGSPDRPKATDPALKKRGEK